MIFSKNLFLSIVNHIKLRKAELLILTKRLTEKQKQEIVESFESGKDIDTLSQENNCTNLTIIRNLKKKLKFKASPIKFIRSWRVLIF